MSLTPRAIQSFGRSRSSPLRSPPTSASRLRSWSRQCLSQHRYPRWRCELLRSLCRSRCSSPCLQYLNCPRPNLLNRSRRPRPSQNLSLSRSPGSSLTRTPSLNPSHRSWNRCPHLGSSRQSWSRCPRRSRGLSRGPSWSRARCSRPSCATRWRTSAGAGLRVSRWNQAPLVSFPCAQMRWERSSDSCCSSRSSW